MFKKAVCSIVIFSFLMTVTSCATIVAGRTQNIPVVSSPSGAIVTIGAMKQMSPATFILDKKQDYVVKVEKEGYEPVEIVLRKGVSGWVWGNILLGLIGGVIGVSIDMGTGAASKFEPSSVEVNLIQKQIGMQKLDGKAVLFVKLVENQK